MNRQYRRPCFSTLVILILMLACSQLYIIRFSIPSKIPNTLTTDNYDKYLKKKNKFISYTSSQWEKLWLKNIKKWESSKCICHAITKQKTYLQEFLNSTCTARVVVRNTVSDWCFHDDTFQPFWINVKTLEHSSNHNRVIEDLMILLKTNKKYMGKQKLRKLKRELRKLERELRKLKNQKGKAFDLHDLPEDKNGSPRIFSKFVFLDEYTNERFVEYIEPLVSHLRHPLAKCEGYIQRGDSNNLTIPEDCAENIIEKDLFYVVKRSYVIPPTSNLHRNKHDKKFYFDAGASSWTEGAGGPSLSYFTTVWERHDINFDHIEAWEGQTQYEASNSTVPDKYCNITTFHNVYIASSAKEHTNESPFVPLVISQKTNMNDYVLFKLDIDNAKVESGIVNHLLSSETNNHLDFIDEFVYEHHVEGNYLLMPHWGYNEDSVSFNVSIEDSYQLFLKLRQRGVRAHSWV